MNVSNFLFKTFFSLLVCCCFCTKNNAQIWFPDDATWTYQVSSSFPFGVDTTLISVGNDTLINSQNAKIIQSNSGNIFSIVYEENDSVFSWSSSNQTWRMIYDFSLIAGDTFLYNSEYEVLETGEIDIMGESRKYQVLRKIFSSQDSPFWAVEGIGVVGTIPYTPIACGHLFPFGWACQSASDGQDFILQCYHDDSIFYDPGKLCFTNTENKPQSNFIYTFPNPANNLLNLKSNSQSNNIKHIEFFDIQGKSFLPNKKSMEQYDVSSLPNGIYFLKIHFENGQQHLEKFVVQH